MFHPASSGSTATQLTPAQTVRTLRIIVLGLVSGIAVTAVVMVILRQNQAGANNAPAAPPGVGILTLLATAYGLLSLVLHRIVPMLVERTQLAQIASSNGAHSSSPDQLTARLLGVFQTRTIIAGALVEGGAFFALVTYLLEGHAISLAVAGLLAGALFTLLPSELRVLAWLNQALTRMNSEAV